MVTNKGTVLKLTAGAPKDGVSAVILSNTNIVSLNYEIVDEKGAIVFKEDVCVIGNTAETNSVFDGTYWTVEKPVLYTYRALVKYENGDQENLCDRFGFRILSADEKYLYLNGYPFYMRAYIRGAAAHEHQNNCGLSNYEFYKKNILMAKSYGFNTIRFHSVIPPEECFRAADELGIMIHIEMRAENLEYDNLHEMLYGKDDFITNDDLLNVIHSLYNHPSFMVYCVGNEIREPGKKPRIREIRDFIKKHDPTRFFIDTCAHGEYDRDGVDFDVQHMGYFFPYAKHGDMFENTDNLLCFGTVNNKDMVIDTESSKIRRKISFKRPLIAHEVCHYTAWRDFYSLKEKFTKYGIDKPWWIDEEIKMIEAKGYNKDFEQTVQITKNFQFRCWKTAIEGIRASNLLSGFHMLQFADTDKYENSNGIVDCFDDPQGISAEEFCKFNADTVLLARLSKQIYESGESVKIPVLFSCYAINPSKSAEFSFNLTDDKKVIANGTLNDVDTSESGLYEICSIEVKMPEVDKSNKLMLFCRLDFDNGTHIENSWELWVFPKVDKIALNLSSDMQGKYLDSICEFTENPDAFITDKLDDSLFEKLDAGKDIVLLYRTDWTRHLLDKKQKAPKYAFRGVWERYKGVIWDRGTINGGRDNKELLNKYGFVTDGEINYQYYPLIEDSDKINLDDFPVEVNSVVSGLDKSNRDRFDPGKFNLPELMYDRTMRHFSYAFALKAGNGRLLVTGFNFTGVEDKDPAACAMLNALCKSFISGDLTTENSISIYELKNYLAKVARSGPNKEGMMTQYWQLDAEPVESMQYWVEAEEYLRKDY